jgi:protein AroM
MVTVGQAPRVDVVPDMVELLGAGVEIAELGALDGLSRAEIERLAPEGDDAVLVTRLADGSAVFVGKRHVTPRVQEKLAELDARGAVVNVLLCTGAFPPFHSARPLLEPERVLVGVLRGITAPGRLGVLTPSERQVPQTEARWRAHGFDPLVVPLSPYEEGEPRALEGAADVLRAGGAGLVVMDCIGFRNRTRLELARLVEIPVLVANLLVARVAAELLGPWLPEAERS